MAGHSGEVIDRVAAVVGNRVVTSSEVELQLRLEAFLNRRPIDVSDSARKQAVERLVEVNFIVEEMRLTNFPPTTEEEVARELQAVREQDHSGKLAFAAALEAHSLSEGDLRDFLRRQMDVLRFVDFRFRTGLDVSEEALKTHYEDVYKPRVRQLEGREPEPFDDVRAPLREVMLQAKVDELLEDWLKLVRASTRVESIDDDSTSPSSAPD